MTSRIADITKAFDSLYQFAKQWPDTKLDPSAAKEGLRASADACQQKEFVFATPLMKNLLVVHGDCKQTYNEKTKQWSTEHLPAGKSTQALVWLDQVVKKCLQKYNGAPRDKYDPDLPIDSVELYNTDCWLAWNPEKFWDIKPGQAKEREEQFKKYDNPKTNFGISQMKTLMKDPIFIGVMDHILKHWPETKADWRVEEIDDPFMSKKTGVSYPFFKNDSTKVPGKDITYGKLCIDIVAKEAKKGINALIKLAQQYSVYTGYPRNQRGKGRALEAMSRIVNLIINMLNGPELKNVQQTEFGIGLVNEQVLKERMIDMGEFVLSHPGYTAANKDLTAFDVTVGSGWVNLQNAIRLLCTKGELASNLVKVRNACVLKSKLINGPSGRVQNLYGRTPSGYIDTTLQNTAVTRIGAEYSCRKVDKDYSENVTYPMKNWNIMTLGDDILAILKRGTIEKWAEVMRSLGFVPHEHDKDALGIMFLQWRLFKYEGQWVMTYNWPRVLRSMLSKEDQKSLGPAGWTLSWWQQLGKLLEYPPALAIALNIAAALDKDHLMLDKSVAEILKMIKQEDAKSINEGGNRRKVTTIERLFNSNPTLRGIKLEQGKPVVDKNYFSKVLRELRKLYDPEFLTKLGFTAPDLSKVH